MGRAGRDAAMRDTARLNLGMSQLQRGDLPAAVATYRALLVDTPASAEAFYNLGMALKQQDEFDEAERALRKACALDATLREAPFTLGVVAVADGPRRRKRPSGSTRR